MQLAAYLKRIDFAGDVRPDLDTLRRLHRAHVEHIPFENLDVQLGRAVSRDPAAIFDKLVVRRRGGWCYEMNGLLASALEAIGFDVVRMAGGVMRAVHGDEMIGNHLVLMVRLDRPYLVDAGFGSGLIEPTPIEAGPFQQRRFGFRLDDLGGGWWRFHGDPKFGTTSFDFETKDADDRLLGARCTWLQTDPSSGFVLNAVAQRYAPAAHYLLRGRVLRTTGDRVDVQVIASADAYVATLNQVFDLDVPDARALWPKIVARHQQLFPDGIVG